MKQHIIRISLVLGLCAVVYYGVPGFLWVEQGISRGVYPVLWAMQWLRDRGTAAAERMRSARELSDTVTAAHDELQATKAELIAVHAKLTAFAEIQKFVEQSITYQSGTQQRGRIIGRVASEEARRIYVDRGHRDGIVVDMVAVAYNHVVGRVSAVYPAYCCVTVLFDSSTRVPVVCADSLVYAIYEGRNRGREGNLLFVSHLQTVHVHELVLTSGDGFVYPQGLAVGRVTACMNTTDGLHHKIVVEPLINIDELTHCFLVQKLAQ